ncbi:unnamed protein product [Adineta ricciae]|uniref:Uncharacterized protein n=1 Tax=Adineta ricciae TaxID=249248 RepID=A0A814MKE4_ADIRI|nr:unnamed protein product [Adineta ricciae]CAF1495864.1 unnamed protein product [Adineta ricciae]
MTNKTNLKRIREIYLRNDNDNLDNAISEDGESNSDPDPDYCASGTESDDTSADEYISKGDDSSDSNTADHDINTNIQPDSLEETGVDGQKNATQATVVFVPST